MKVLPELLKSLEFGGGGPRVFASVMRIAAKLSEDDYDTKVTPVIIRLFSNPDRAIRVCLLDNLPNMIDRLSQKVVNDRIFPQMVCCHVSYQHARESSLNTSDHRVFGCCPTCKRADRKGTLNNHHQAL